MSAFEAVAAGLGALIIVVVLRNVIPSRRLPPHNDGPTDNSAAVSMDGD